MDPSRPQAGTSARTLDANESSPASPLAHTVGYEEAPRPSARAAGDAAGAVSGFEATIVGDARPVPAGPVSGFEATIQQGNTPLSPPRAAAPGAPPSGPSPGSLGASMSRSTVLPRVEVLEGQPRISHRDRPRYQERKKLGEGGVGEVVMVQDNDIERLVALKRLRPGLQGTTALARFVEEIRTVGQLEHPSIVPIHDVGLDEQGHFYFVMKYVQGETIEQIIEKLAAGDAAYHQRYPFERRVEIFLGILEAMSYAHDKGIIHRDIKPANIMVGPYGEVVVMDWGLAKKVGHSDELLRREPEGDDDLKKSGRLQETRVGSLLGTPLYMSPEQARGQHAALDARSDIYSLSVMLFEFLTLRHYLHDHTNLNQVLLSVGSVDTPAVRDSQIWEAAPVQGVVPADLRHFVLKGMQKDPAQRYASVHEMIERLQRRAQGEIPIECPITFWMSLLGRGRRLLSNYPMVAASMMIVLTLASVASMFYTSTHRCPVPAHPSGAHAH